MAIQSKRTNARLLGAVALVTGSGLGMTGFTSRAQAQNAVNVELSTVSQTITTPDDGTPITSTYSPITIPDFAGENYDAADTKDTGTTWNSLICPNTLTFVPNGTGSNLSFPVEQNLALVNSQGATSGISISQINFTENNGKNDTIHSSGINNATTTGTDGQSATPAALMNNSWFDNGNSEVISFTLAGLNPGAAYNLYIYGSGQNFGYGGSYTLATANQPANYKEVTTDDLDTSSKTLIYRSVFSNGTGTPSGDGNPNGTAAGTPEPVGLSWVLLPAVADPSGDLTFNVVQDTATLEKGSINGFQLDTGTAEIVPLGTWVDGASGNSNGTLWSDQTNWSSGGGSHGVVPNAVGATATFSNQSTLTMITVDSNFTVGNMVFNSAAAYTLAPQVTASGTIAGVGSLTLDNGGASATAYVTNSQGAHEIDAPMVLGSNTTFSTAASGDYLAILGNISSEAGRTTGLTFDGTGNAYLSLQGTNTYTGPTVINSGILKIQGLAALPVGGAINNNGQLSIQKGIPASQNGTLGAEMIVVGNITGTGGLVVGTNNTAMLQIAPNSGVSMQTSVVIQSTSGTTLESELDITNNKLVINYGANADPVSTIQGYLATGADYSGTADAWDGLGITSSTAAAGGGKYDVGYLDGDNTKDALYNTVAANQIIIAYTLKGDAFLEGSVGFHDLLVVAQDYQKTGMDYAEGCFDYDSAGSVGFSDLLAVAQNYGQSYALAGSELGGSTLTLGFQAPATSAVPEPGSFALLAVGAGMLARRRRAIRS